MCHINIIGSKCCVWYHRSDNPYWKNEDKLQYPNTSLTYTRGHNVSLLMAYLKYAAPQDSVLRPFLYTMYTSYLCTIIECHGLKSHLKAPDTLHVPMHTINEHVVVKIA